MLILELFFCRNGEQTRIDKCEDLKLTRKYGLLNQFDILGHYVISLGAVTSQLIGMIPLEDVGAGLCKIDDNLELASVRSKV